MLLAVVGNTNAQLIEVINFVEQAQGVAVSVKHWLIGEGRGNCPGIAHDAADFDRLRFFIHFKIDRAAESRDVVRCDVVELNRDGVVGG